MVQFSGLFNLMLAFKSTAVSHFVTVKLNVFVTETRLNYLQGKVDNFPGTHKPQGPKSPGSLCIN